MATETEIANLASARIGSETRITSLDEDRHVARTLKAVWNIERRATIRDGAFNFAMARKALASLFLPDGPPYPWGYAFELPADCLRLIEVLNVSCGAYQLEGNRVLTDTGGPLYIRYLMDVAEPASWSDDFAETFACRLAWKVGHRIAGSSYDEAGGEAEYRRAIARVKQVDALENPAPEQDPGEWITSRWGGNCHGSNPARWG